MLAHPDTTIRYSPSEPIALDPVVEGVGRVRITPAIGEQTTVSLDNIHECLETFSIPNRLKLEWLGNENVKYESAVELVSRHYFPLDSLRNKDKDVDGFDDENMFPEEMLFEARQAATDVFEQAARRSFVHRLGRTKDYGRDSLVNLYHGDVYELLCGGYVQVSDCQLERGHDYGRQYPFWIEYLYGADEMPSEISRAVLELAAYTLRPTNRPIGATGESSDAGYIHFTTAGRDGATSIPEVNAAIEQFGRGVQYVW